MLLFSWWSIHRLLPYIFFFSSNVKPQIILSISVYHCLSVPSQTSVLLDRISFNLIPSHVSTTRYFLISSYFLSSLIVLIRLLIKHSNIDFFEHHLIPLVQFSLNFSLGIWKIISFKFIQIRSVRKKSIRKMTIPTLDNIYETWRLNSSWS